MRSKNYPTLAALMVLTCCFAIYGCGNNRSTPNYEFPDDPDPFTTTELSGYPTGLKVYSFIDLISGGGTCSGFIAVADLKNNAKIKFNAAHFSPAKTPTQIHAAYSSKGRGTPQVVINGGYFWAGSSLSLLVSDGSVESLENQSVVRKNTNNESVTVYALRSGFGQMQSGSFEASWIYCVGDDGNKPYAFASPLDNNEQTKTYMPSPPNSTTVGGAPWVPVEAIGGGPMLVREGKNVAVSNYWKECFDGGGIAGLSRQPRTAIGATADGKLVLIVCDGRGMNDSKGYSLAELADRLIQQGVVRGINLDGGGSSTFVGHEGSVLNRPSDTGSGSVIKQRNVPTAIVLTLQN